MSSRFCAHMCLYCSYKQILTVQYHMLCLVDEMYILTLIVSQEHWQVADQNLIIAANIKEQIFGQYIN
jgi:hypothetical protein